MGHVLQSDAGWKLTAYGNLKFPNDMIGAGQSIGGLKDEAAANFLMFHVRDASCSSVVQRLLEIAAPRNCPKALDNVNRASGRHQCANGSAMDHNKGGVVMSDYYHLCAC